MPAGAAGAPRPVSPGARTAGAVAELRCPNFSWAGIPGASGYELAVFRLEAAVGAEPVLVTRVTVAGDARAWTPGVGQCLERGQRYAWSVAAITTERDRRAAGAAESDEHFDDSRSASPDATRGRLDWSPAFLFEVEAAPSPDELEHALATLERYLDRDVDAESRNAAASSTAELARTRDAVARAEAERRRVEGRVERTAERTADARRDFLPGALASSSSGIVRLASAATSTPALGDASLTVSDQIHLGAASDLFKADTIFLWDDTSGNTALGRNALASVTNAPDYDATNNTAVGRGALRNTTGGAFSFHGTYNTAVGDRALYASTTGFRNTAVGAQALGANTTGFHNTAIGRSALQDNTSGYLNTASGHYALLHNTTGLRNTASGVGALFNNNGNDNTADGFNALQVNTTGLRNTASGSGALASNNGNDNTANGFQALLLNTTGVSNTGSGISALGTNTTGSGNIALGFMAGVNNTTGDSSIFIGNQGTPTDTFTIKIGVQGLQTSTYVGGISNSVVSGLGVLVDTTTGRLGVAASSASLKRDVQDISALGDRVLELRPVAFRYKQQVEADPDTSLEFGLIAEEVAEVFPELAIYDRDGKPSGVKYHLLSALLLGELQEQHTALEQQRVEHRAELQQLADRLEALEARGDTAVDAAEARGRR